MSAVVPIFERIIDLFDVEHAIASYHELFAEADALLDDTDEGSRIRCKEIREKIQQTATYIKSLVPVPVFLRITAGTPLELLEDELVDAFSV